MTNGWATWLKPFGPVFVSMLLLILQPWGWMGSLPIVFFALVGLVWGLRHLHRVVRREQRMREAQTALELLSRQRHDWMNHIQVIMGYCSVGKPERIPPYLQRLAGTLEEERKAARVNDPCLAYALATLNQRFPEWHWTVHLDEEPRFTPEEGEAVVCALETVGGFLRRKAGDNGDPPDVLLRLSREENHLILTFLPEADPECRILPEEREQLRQQLKPCNGKPERFGENGMTVRIPLHDISRGGLMK